jgi:hypothetical protein
MIVLFKFKPTVSLAHKDAFVTQLKALKKLSCVLDNRLIIGGPSITEPIERSKGYEFALLSFHQDRKALEEYQASSEHKRYEVTTAQTRTYTNSSIELLVNICGHTRRTLLGLTLRLPKMMSICANLSRKA